MRPWIPIIALLCGCDSVFGLGELGAPAQPADAMIDAPILTGWKATAAGGLHSCGIRADDTLWCWGDNELGNIGTADPAGIVSAPAQVGTNHYKSVSSTGSHTCAIALDDTLWCWGGNDFGQLGLGHDVAAPVPRQIDGTWKYVSAGGYSTCAIKSDDSLWCWGYNYWGEVGNGMPMMQSPLPSRVGIDRWLDVDIGYYTTCGVQLDHTLWCWGNNSNATYGNGTPSVSSAVPVAISGESWNKVDVGVYNACGITTAGALRCWGYSTRGSNGSESSMLNVPTPMLIESKDTSDWVQLSVNHDFGCGIRMDGSLWCWGDNGHGQLGVDAIAYSSSPVQITRGAASWRRVDTGTFHTCAIAGDDALWCFGGDGRAQLGDGPTSKWVPTQMPGTLNLLSLGAFLSCGTNAAGTITCAGYNAYGGIGDLTTEPRKVMTPMQSTLTGWSRVAPGVLHTCAANASGTYCWGANYYGQLGSNTMVDSLTPLLIGGELPNMEASEHTCGIAAGQIYCWGYNYYGQVGNGGNANVLVATAISNTFATDIAVGLYHTCAVINGVASCWGRGTEGQLGDGTLVTKASPSAVYTVASGNLSLLDAGAYHTCAIATTGRLWCWGGNDNGQLGTGDKVPRAIPTAVGTATWTQIAAGNQHTCGIQSDTTLWCWGKNARGQVGIGSFVDRYLPAQLPGTGWLTVDAGGERTCASKAGGAFWCWGANDHGGVPDDTAWQPLPRRVP